MIEVIRDNTKEKFYTVCENCLSELSYDYEDVIINDIEYSYIPDRHITCPVCHKETFTGLKTKETYTFDGNHFKPISGLLSACCSTTPPGTFNGPD